MLWAYLTIILFVPKQETVEFYKEAFYAHESERDDVVHQMTKYVIGRERKGEFLKLIDRVTAEKGKIILHFLMIDLNSCIRLLTQSLIFRFE